MLKAPPPAELDSTFPIVFAEVLVPVRVSVRPVVLKASVVAPVALGAALNVIELAVGLTETMVVLPGMFVPVTDIPATRSKTLVTVTLVVVPAVAERDAGSAATTVPPL